MTVTVTGGITFSGGGFTFTPAAAAANDPYFMYNSLLLPGDGTNLAQNNTFLDGSTNNFAVTRNGNTTQGTFSPYGPNWSNYFDGTGDKVTAAANVAFQFGTSDFTIEFWLYPTALSNYQTPIEMGYNSSGSWVIQVGAGASNNTPILYSGGVALLTASSGWTTNTWNHVVVCRSGTTLSLFINGSRVATATNSTNFNASASVGIGAAFNAVPDYPINGYMSNVRIVKGTAVYNPASATITVPTTPLTPITNTSLLTSQSNRFIDNSTNAFAITVNGNTNIQRFSPFSPTAAYSAGTIGGSGYFDGTGDFLGITTTTALQMTGDFTWEAWVYPLSLPGSGYKTFWAQRNVDAAVGGPAVVIDTSGNILLFISDAAATTWAISGFNTSLTISLNQWQHIALVKSGSSLKLYKNGVAGTATTSSEAVGTNGSTTLMAGAANGAQTVDGYMSNFRAVKGTAVYTANFTPPTAPVTAITNTSLLTNFTNAGIIDNAMINNLETVGNAKISTVQSKFGGSSMSFDGSTAYARGISSVNRDFGTGDFTIEFWVYHNVLKDYSGIVGEIPGASSIVTINLYTYANGRFGVTVLGTNEQMQTAASVAIATTWQHVALVRYSGVVTLYVGGVSRATYTSSANMQLGNGSGLSIGATIGTGYLNGYVDDLRVTKGVARYTTTFTPPTQAFPTY